MNYILKRCDGTNIDLSQEYHQNENRFVNFFNEKNSWASAVLEAINNRTEVLQLLDSQINTLIDCGAHIGMFSLFAEPFCEKIYSIEPTRKCYELLNSLTNKHPKIHPIFGAIGNENRSQILYEDTVNNTQNSLLEHFNSRVIGNVQVFTIEKIIQDFNIESIDFLKIDIEGGEIPLILGNVFDKNIHKIKKIYIECHNIEFGHLANDWQTNQFFINNKLNNLGFKTKIIRDVILAWK